MRRFLKWLLGIGVLEARVERLEKSQTSEKRGDSGAGTGEPLYCDVLDEWLNGERKDGEHG